MQGWNASQLPASARHRGHVGVRERSGQSASGAGYTLAHAGRQIRFGPVAFWITVGTVVIMAGWSITTATYFAFREDVLKGLIARQSAQQFAYEDRIADLRAQIDRTTSRQLLDQDQFERKLDEIAHRQTTLEAHAASLSALADATPTGSIRPSRSAQSAPSAKSAPLGEQPAAERPRHGAWLEPLRTLVGGQRTKTAGLEGTLDRVEASLDRVEQRQTAALRRMEADYEGKAQRMRNVLAELGLRRGAPPSGLGGPFIPVKLPGESESFGQALARVNLARQQTESLTRLLTNVPVRYPVMGEIDISSPFGVRIDPFLHVASMHTGIDFRGNVGDPIRATAAGKVVTAGWSGGYGKMVEIDHGNGLSTRYGHLSEIDVYVGDSVRIGQIIGRMGSTGRSTGPHVHYETRVNGEAVDPQKFLTAGAKLFGE
jgi:murein DD-endopeptidase MepM/ murein hydrolase activator NlpD